MCTISTWRTFFTTLPQTPSHSLSAKVQWFQWWWWLWLWGCAQLLLHGWKCNLNKTREWIVLVCNCLLQLFFMDRRVWNSNLNLIRPNLISNCTASALVSARSHYHCHNSVCVCVCQQQCTCRCFSTTTTWFTLASSSYFLLFSFLYVAASLRWNKSPFFLPPSPSLRKPLKCFSCNYLCTYF